jgi:hypothetical protein
MSLGYTSGYTVAISLACFLRHNMNSFSLEARLPSPPADPVYEFLQLVAQKLSHLGNQ